MKQVVRQVVDGVREEMARTIQFGDDSFSWEKDYDRATVIVECHEVRLANGFVIMDATVLVDHDNGNESPMLEQAIREALPDWWQVRKEIESEFFN